jgi:ferredoxin
MPWIDESRCVGCGVCADSCPSEAISVKDGKAGIDMDKCIHCGRCHDSCPQNAVMHDSDRIPSEIDANVKQTKSFMDACSEHFGNPEKEKGDCLSRMIKHYRKERLVAEKTLERLESLKKGG